MTYQYSEINQHDALYKAARSYPGGVEALAQRLGISPKMLYKKLTPSVEEHGATFEEVSEIIENLESVGREEKADMVLGAFCWRHHRVVIKLPDAPASEDNLLKHVLTLIRDEGRLFGNVKDFLNGDLPKNKANMQMIEKDLQLCITSMVTLRSFVLSRFSEE